MNRSTNVTPLYRDNPIGDDDAYIWALKTNRFAPQAMPGDELVISPGTKLAAGMIAVLYPENGTGPVLERLVTVPPPGGFPKLSADSEVAHRLLVDRPPGCLAIRATAIAKIHGVVGLLRDGTYRARDAEADLARVRD